MQGDICQAFDIIMQDRYDDGDDDNGDDSLLYIKAMQLFSFRLN